MDLNNLLNRGVEDIIVKKELEKKLQAGKKLRVKLGIDPTGSDLHIGHAVVLKKLREFQELGHQVIFLIGDYTARIGDPTGKSETRKMLSEEEIQSNMKQYIEQASKILDIDNVEIRHNSEWFAKMSMGEILEINSLKTVNQMLQREDFKNRINNEQDISITELMYPIMQGYDSVMLESDVELGGTDQLFNMLVGRDLQKKLECKTIQNIITVPILEGLDGVEKMSKSLNNFIGLTESPQEIFGKTMSIPDSLITKYFELATTVPLEQIQQEKKELKTGKNPRDSKVALAKAIVTIYHDQESANHAEKEFIEIFKKKGLPDDIEKKQMKGDKWNIVELLAENKMVSSNSEARRLIQGGAIKVNGEKVTSHEAEIDISEEIILQAGKRKFLKIESL